MALLREETRVIDGIQINVIQRDCLAQAEIWERLLQLVAPAGAHLSDMKDLSSILGADVGNIVGAFGILGGQLAGPDGRWVKTEILKTAFMTVDGNREPITEHTLRTFVADVSTLYKIYAFALEVNFKNFILIVRDLISRVSPVVKKASLSS